MADIATYIGVTPVSITLTAAAVSRGYRVTRNSSGLCAVQDISARGDYVTLRDGDASEEFRVIQSMNANPPNPSMIEKEDTVESTQTTTTISEEPKE